MLLGEPHPPPAFARPPPALLRTAQNPLVAEGEVIGRGANYLWPDLSGSASSSSSSSSSSEDGSGSNGGSESGDSFSSAASEVDADSDSDRGAAVGVPEEPEQAAEPVASAPPEGGKPAAAPNAPETITAPAPAGPAAVGEMDDDGSSTVSSDYLEAEHGHGHKHGAAGADEEPHRCASLAAGWGPALLASWTSMSTCCCLCSVGVLWRRRRLAPSFAAASPLHPLRR